MSYNRLGDYFNVVMCNRMSLGFYFFDKSVLIMMFGIERYTLLEDFFDPIVGENDRSVCSAVMTCLEKVRTIFQYATYKNVVVTGGNSLIRGFKERLSLDLSNRVQFPQGVNVVTSFDVSDKLYAAWIGGTIVANSKTFNKIAFSRQQYMEHGKTYIHEICP